MFVCVAIDTGTLGNCLIFLQSYNTPFAKMKTFGSCRRFLFLFLYFVISKLITTNASTTGHEVFNLEQIISENNTQELTEFLKSLNESVSAM